MKKTKLPKSLGLLILAAAISETGFAQTTHNITFDEPSVGLQHGSLFAGNEYSGLGGGVTFTVDSNGSHDQLLVFDTQQSGTADPDLESPFAGGNLQGVQGLGNALIIAENIIDRNNDGFVDSPDDEARGGTIGVVFGNNLVQSIGFNLYDTPESRNSNVSVIFRDASGASVTWNPGDLLANGTNVSFANHYGNRFEDVTASQLGLQNIQSVDFNIESGAVDSLTFKTVPEPSSAALLGLGVTVLLLRRRRA